MYGTVLYRPGLCLDGTLLMLLVHRLGCGTVRKGALMKGGIDTVPGIRCAIRARVCLVRGSPM